MKISDFSIKRPVFTIVTMFLIIILGAVSFFKIPVTLIPDLNPPVAVVVANYSGASPTEVSEKLTKPLEESLSTSPGLKTLQSTSQEGATLVFMMFDWSADIDDVQLDILQRIDQVPVPEGADKPRFMKFDPSQFPVIQLSLKTAKDDVDIRKIADELETELRQTEGVASVSVSGKLVEEIQIKLDENKLEKNGLTQADIVQAVQASNVTMPGEPVSASGGKQLTTRIVSTLSTAEDIGNVIIGPNPVTGKRMYVKDVAAVNRTEAANDTITRANDEQAVLLSVLQESGANTAEVSSSFKESLDRLLDEKQFKDVEADILFDQGDYVQLAINNIGQSLILGGLFAMVVLFFFLKGIRSPIIIGVAIPYSVIVTFVLMFFADFSLNIMTLGALALGIGMLVDNAIVVIENIERHLAMGKDRKTAASEGAKEIGGAIIASTLTTLAVFVPVIFISGLIGQIFTQFALTISFSLFASLVVALTVVPMMASRMLRKPRRNVEARRRRSRTLRTFENSVKWSLRNRALILVCTIVLLAASAFGLFKVGTEFLPSTDEGFFSINVDLPNGSSLASTDDAVKKVEDILKEQKDVDVYVSLVGGTQQSMAQGGSQADTAEMYVKLKPLDKRDRSVFDFMDDVKPKVEEAVGDSADVSFNVQAAAGSSPNTLSFSLEDTNEARLTKAIGQVDEKLRSLDGVTDVSNNLMDTVEEVKVTVDRELAANFGLAPYQVAQIITDATRGTFATQVVDKDDNVLTVNVQYDKKFYEDTGALRKIKLRTPSGQYIKLGQVAKIDIAEGPVAIQRVDQAHSVSYDIKYENSRSLGEMTKAVNEAIDGLDLPDDVKMSYSGDRELFENAANDMLLAIILAVVLVYIVMAAQFESFKYPFVIMFSVPLMIIGVAIGLFATQTPISVTAVIGILVLVGIVVNNGIVLVDYINQQKEKGMPSYEAIVISVKNRVRPILMTALTTILGLLPLALGIGEGTEINQPMGIAVIGGLISSTFLTLFIVPVIYSLFDRETRRRARPKSGYTAADSEEDV
ncbi:efflux RND transporter permease subunit [Sporosarcina trichiuri]|uniref:efflux RND transporter permease subunit n=1 Tax=Sporosarcina trichiuri TaxID=3056445 RepID=UPI0025B60469|nr:efflux RND transporter permease subunit [Sporosarcina sp. 0.2-SM1T-5]WJY28900.1 efflux RND transporter permease subunit [Sporosarcina sp. 0.2-SM1T-5]